MTRGSPKSLGSLLDSFLTDSVMIYLTNVSTTIQSETGEVVDVPLILDGVLWDYDMDYLLIGDENKVQFSLVNRQFIAKIDVIDKTSEVMLDPNKPNNPIDMN